MVRAPLLAVVALSAAAVALPSADAAAKGQEHVLVILASTGAEPYSVSEVKRTFEQTAAFIERSSFGQMHVDADVTPWLTAAVRPICGANAGTADSLFAPPRSAAAGAGFDASRYDTVVYALPDEHCGFFGATFGHQVMLTREPSVDLLLHELGHTFGLGHAQGADCIDLLRCALEETGDTLSPMGSGSLDYSAYEKWVLGWIPDQPHVSAPKRFVLAPPTARSRLAQALVVETVRGTWWIEYRARPFRGLTFRFLDPENHSAPYAPSAVLMLDPSKHHRPWITKGESYRIPFSWRVTLTSATATQAEVRFRP